MSNEPFSMPWITYLWVIGLGAWGGLVNYVHRSVVSPEHKQERFSLVELIGEMSTSGFAGTLVYWLCLSWDLNPLLIAFFIGIAGHMGSRTLYLLEKEIARRLKAIVEQRREATKLPFKQPRE